MRWSIGLSVLASYFSLNKSVDTSGILSKHFLVAPLQSAAILRSLEGMLSLLYTLYTFYTLVMRLSALTPYAPFMLARFN